MSNEEMQKKMEFIVEQQVLFARNFKKREEAPIRHEQSLPGLEAAYAGLARLATESALARNRTANATVKLTELIDRLAVSMESINKRIAHLIVLIERLFNEKQNGPGPSQD